MDAGTREPSVVTRPILPSGLWRLPGRLLLCPDHRGRADRSADRWLHRHHPQKGNRRPSGSRRTPEGVRPSREPPTEVRRWRRALPEDVGWLRLGLQNLAEPAAEERWAAFQLLRWFKGSVACLYDSLRARHACLCCSRNQVAVVTLWWVSTEKEQRPLWSGGRRGVHHAGGFCLSQKVSV